MSFQARQVRWECVHRSDGPTIFLPVGVDRSNWKEVSRVGDRFARFIDSTGKLVDCAEYVRMAEEEASA